MSEWWWWLVERFGVTRGHRERALAARLASSVRKGEQTRGQVQRVERLLHYREGLGAVSIDTDSIRLALYGEGWQE